MEEKKDTPPEPEASATPAESTAAPGTLDRRSVLIGALGGVVSGGGAGFFAGGQDQKAKDLARADASAKSAKPPPPPRPSGSHPSDASAGDASGPKAATLSQSARLSFAQQGEDLVMQGMLFDVAGIISPTYIDIGAFEPILSNNTYLFYAGGAHGVLVEPNPAYTPKLRAERPRDVVLEVGVGVTNQAEADYYLFTDSAGQLNTFSKEQADKLKAAGATLEKVIKRQLVNINEILAQNFKDAAPDVFSIDIEGLDLEVLKTLNFERWRPLVICTETSEFGTGRVEKETLDFLATKQYEVRGGSYVNTVFLDKRPRPKKKKP